MGSTDNELRFDQERTSAAYLSQADQVGKFIRASIALNRKQLKEAREQASTQDS